MSPMANEPSSPMCLMPQSGITPEQLSLISRFAVASIGSQGTVGGLLVGGLVSHTLSSNSELKSKFFQKKKFF